MRGWLLLAGLALLQAAGCAGTELVAEARGIRGVVKTARDRGAYRCAPGELALAEAHVEFAEQELSNGDYFRARDHLGIADWNAREAMRLASDAGCQARRRPGDGDRDGVPDGRDKCPAQAEDVDGFQDDDGCPDPDNDRDGVPDGQDKCPTEAEDKDGHNDSDGCPDGDDDGDGVPDASDKCPKDREDKDGFEDDDGCGDPDNDKDGVLDAEDKCPNQAGLRLAQGCPQPYSLITVTAEKIEIKQTIFFHTAKAVILAKSYPLLDEVASAIKSRPSMKVRIEGHTDGRGKRQTNLRLSQARADAVKAYLAGAGVDAERLESKGFGPDQPIETNRTTAGRERNRRVEFVITSQ
jgi:outer membrane protein OmpA-like peptidoglycan-associated protein